MGAVSSPLKNSALMLRQAQHERGTACGTRLSAHPEPVEGRAESLFQRTVRAASLLLAIALVFAACGDGSGGGSGDPLAPLPVVAYVVTECREGPATDGYFVGRQELRIRQRDGSEVVVQEFGIPPLRPELPQLCALFGQGRDGHVSAAAGAFHRLEMSPDGSILLFEVTDDFSILGQNLLVAPEQEGIFLIRTDGSGLRRLGPASRNPSFRLDLSIPAFLADLNFGFRADGGAVVFTDFGPGPTGVDEVQVFTLDLTTGERRQVTRLPPAPPLPAYKHPTSFPSFLDDETVSFYSYANPVVDAVELNPEGVMRLFSVKTDDPRKLRVIPVVAEGAGNIIEAFQITGAEPSATNLRVPGTPVNGPSSFLGNVVLEAFVLDGDGVLQLTNFQRSDPAGARVSSDRQRVFFLASTDKLGTNPFQNCQIFSIDRTGSDLRQLTNFDVGEPSTVGCGLLDPTTGCSIYGKFNQDPVTRSILFYSSCDPLGTNPTGGQVFAMRPDGSGLHQVTDCAGMIIEPDGTVRVELPGPLASPGRPR